MRGRCWTALVTILVASACGSATPEQVPLAPPGVAALPAPCRGEPVGGVGRPCASALARTWAPLLIVSERACNWDPAAARLGGGYLFAAYRAPDRFRIAYLPAYFDDCGWRGLTCVVRFGCGAHAADSEAIVVELVVGEGGRLLRPERVFLSAHCFGRRDPDCRWHPAGELRWSGTSPLVWVARGKNANYPTPQSCERGHRGLDTCARNRRAYRFPVGGAGWIGADADRRRCVGATDLSPPPPGGGVECPWTDAAFRGWWGGDVEGVTPYARYLREVLIGAEPGRTLPPQKSGRTAQTPWDSIR